MDEIINKLNEGHYLIVISTENDRRHSGFLLDPFTGDRTDVPNPVEVVIKVNVKRIHILEGAFKLLIFSIISPSSEEPEQN